MSQLISKQISIHAPASAVWNALTNVHVIPLWMGEAELQLQIDTTWEAGSSIVITGFHHTKFENKGVVLECVPHRVLAYNFLSSLSRLPDVEENYTNMRFALSQEGDCTELSLTLVNFPTETIYQHLNFYWGGALGLLKRMLEG